MSRRDRYIPQAVIEEPTPVPKPVDASPAARAPEKPKLAERYLVRGDFRFTRNSVVVHLKAGRIIDRSKEGAIIDEAIKFGAQIEAIDGRELHVCPHCKAIDVVR